ncbi:ferredoxin family protein [uncultured Abyssibacter sp.]|uniref:4Fe-4S dicluster domain-containing protein n=1 Tax=uncultured Abyssibacter sp. TaxID=2320202 RepID=UPI0032B3054A|tara:strand:+ start:130 stop:396 length:267 start_codon:yes stop_codon:yes gene_type:complete
MTYVIVGSCVNDAVCTEVCPVDCIQPAPEAGEFATTEMLYIDPDVCIDCKACADACPINAIYPAEHLPDKWTAYREINAAFFRQRMRS